MKRVRQNSIIVLLAGALLAFPVFVSADLVGDQKYFTVDPSYDESKRTGISATLRVQNSKVYLYIDDAWWNSLQSFDQYTTQQNLISLATEFEQNIYPKITQVFGTEWTPGIDNDTHSTILFHAMRQDAGGYTNYGDEYSAFENPNSNERELMYLNLRVLSSPLVASYLSHELMHLITFNQKEHRLGIQEDVWLNEGRAEYMSTFMGYDNIVQNSNLKKRMQDFLLSPTDSLTEWNDTVADYGVTNLFIQYVVDQYGQQILVDSLKSNKVGLASLDYALQKGGFKDSIEQVFLNWTITLFLNDCSYGSRYCYHNPYLVNLRVVPQTNFLPSIGESTLSITSATKDWSPVWLKVLGGRSQLKVEFSGNGGARYRVPFLVEDTNRKYRVEEFVLDSAGNGKFILDKFNAENRAVIFLPIAVTATIGFDKPQTPRFFSFTVSTSDPPQDDLQKIKDMFSKIEYLKGEIMRLQLLLHAQSGQVSLCQGIVKDLYLGLKDSEDVRCLQGLLNKEGVYPEGFITGNFFLLTQEAVVKFQEKYASDILTPVGLSKGTGFVGQRTREKINTILHAF